MPPSVLLLGGVTGAILGSFISTAALRALQGRSALAGRSACDGCGIALGFIETAPIVSFVRRGGHCQACGAPIPVAHLAGEAVGALSGLAIVALAPVNAWPALMVAGAALLFAAIYDAGRLRIPDAAVGLVAIAGLVAAALQGRLAEAALTGLAAGALLAVVASAFRRRRGRTGLGFGDVKLLAALAIWSGPSLTPLGVALAAGMALAWLAWRGAPEIEARVPFAPFIAAAFWPLLLGRLA